MNSGGQRLYQIRRHRKISQGRIAKAIGVSVGTIQNYEHGRVAVTVDRLEQLARALQCETADLLAEPGSPPPRYYSRGARKGHNRTPRQMALPLTKHEED